MELKKTDVREENYYWRCPVDEAYKRFEYQHSVRMACWIWGITGMLIAGIFFASGEITNPLFLLIAVAGCALLILLTVGIARLILHSKRQRSMLFQLNESRIRIGSGKSSIDIWFNDVCGVQPVPEENHIILTTRHSEAVICLPPEDFTPLCRLITEHVENESRIK